MTVFERILTDNGIRFSGGGLRAGSLAAAIREHGVPVPRGVLYRCNTRTKAEIEREMDEYRTAEAMRAAEDYRRMRQDEWAEEWEASRG